MNLGVKIRPDMSAPRIRYRNIAVIGLAASLLLVLVGLAYTSSQEKAVLEQNERAMQRLTDSVIEGLTSVMLAGSAEIAQSYADRLKRMPEISDFRILRTNGEEAFRDNATIDSVNRRRGESMFTPRDLSERIQVVSPDDAALRRVIAERKPLPIYETAPNGIRTLNFYAPIENQAACHKCHSEVFPVRGVVRLSTSLAPIDRDILRIRQQSLIVIAMALMIVMLSTGYLIGRAVLDERDEAVRDAGGLHAIAAIIQDADEGIVVTDRDGRVVLVNPAAEHLLGKSADRIVGDGFEQMLDEPERMRSIMSQSGCHGSMLAEHLGRTLRVFVSTVRSNGLAQGAAALLRDVSHEQHLEDELQRLATTDALTGLCNRRHLDDALKTEFLRTLRTHSALSILALDIDGFTALRDERGEETANRVLAPVAQALRGAMRKYDLPGRLADSQLLAVLPDTDGDGALAVAERLRADLAAANIEGLGVTVSLGVANYPGVIDAPEGLLDEAERALQRCRDGGGNRVMLAQVHTDSPDPGVAAD